MNSEEGNLQNPSSASSQTASISFDDVSNLFSLPLSDAADSIGVCTNVLKKICHDNGLVRWPYRKFLSGKSIEEIKRDAARERTKGLPELSKAAGERNDALASSATSSSPGSQLKNSSFSPVQEMPKSQGIALEQQGNKNIQSGKSQNVHSPSLTKGTLASLDEFKYGFPSAGLSTASHRWWGSSSPDATDDEHGDGWEDAQEDKQSKDLAVDGSLLMMDGEKPESGKNESHISVQGTGLLSSVRKRAAEVGREALKLGVCGRDGISKLNKRERTLLIRIFRTSFSSQWT